MKTDRLGKDGFFEVFSFANQIRHRVAVIDPRNVLVDDWAFVKVCCGVVCCGPDQFDAPSVRLVIRLAASEMRAGKSGGC